MAAMPSSMRCRPNSKMLSGSEAWQASVANCDTLDSLVVGKARRMRFSLFRA